MRERVGGLPTAPQRDQWRHEGGFRNAANKTLQGELTPEEFEKYAIAAGIIQKGLAPKTPSYPLQVKRFKSENQGKRHDPIPLSEHAIFSHAPLLDHHRAKTLSAKQKQTRIGHAYDLYLLDRFTLSDFAREQRFFDKYGPSRQPDSDRTRAHHELPSQVGVAETSQAPVVESSKPFLQVIFDHLPTPIRALR